MSASPVNRKMPPETAVNAMVSGVTGHRTLTSEALFRGHGELRILHAGREYRLTVTRQGKLILTK